MAFLLSARGLQTFTNELSSLEGAQQKADNVVIDEDGVIEPRRGFADYSATTPTPIKQLMEYKNRLFRHYGSTLQWDNGSGTFTSFTGSFMETQAGLRLKYQESNGNLYVTTASGVRKLSITSNTQLATTDFTVAGGVKAIGFEAILNPETTYISTIKFLLDTKSVAYRVVWGIKDVNSNLILGYPSTRVVVTNTSGSDKAVLLTVLIPEEVDSDLYFYQIYRTGLSSSADATGDEMQLVFEGNTTSAERTAREFIYLDETPDSFRASGDYLYTNATTGEGILQANEKPPIAKDIALFKNSLFYANTKTRHRLELQLYGTANLVGKSLYVVNTNGTREYKFVGSPSTEGTTSYGGDVLVSSTGSAALDIDQTARSLERIINKDIPSDIYCFYISSDNTLPGQMVFENIELNDIIFYVNVSDAAISANFIPVLPVTPSSTVVSNNEESPNRLYYSKFGQPEAVPALNYVDIGAKDSAILRIAALRDQLYIFKTDGVYTASGDATQGFYTALLDGTTKIWAPDSLATINNKIYLLSMDGITSVVGSGISVVSRNIENKVLEILNTSMSTPTLAFGIASDTDRSYFLFTPSSVTDTYATQCYRYNTYTDTWTRWTNTATCGIISSYDDKICLADGARSLIVQERKNRDRTDYADRDFEVNFVEDTISGNSIAVDSILDMAIGDVFLQTQYVTLYEFNSTLRKLDLDLGLAQSAINGGAGFVSTLKLNYGNNLQLKLIALDAMLASDANIGTWSTITFPSDFSGQQVQFNLLADQLNAPTTGTFLKNYFGSSGTTFYEAIITDINKTLNIITLNVMMPFIHSGVDGCRVFKAIVTDVQWKPQHFGDPSKTKQVRETTLLMDQNNFYNGTLSYSSDVSTYFEDITVYGRGNGSFGSASFGADYFGGEGADVPFRVLVPRDKQRCRYLTCRFKHINAREKFRVLGISIEMRPVSSRGYR